MAPTPPLRTPRFLSEVPSERSVTSAGFNRTRAESQGATAVHRGSPITSAPQATATPPPPSPSAPAPAAADDSRLKSAIEHLRQYSSRLAEQTRSDALEIGFQVARRILETELTTSPAPLFGLIRSAVQRLGEARKVTIRLNPGDLARIQTPEGAPDLGLTVAQVELLPDSTLETGDCIVESELGRVDGRLSTRLAELARVLNAEEAA